MVALDLVSVMLWRVTIENVMSIEPIVMLRTGCFGQT